MGRLSSSTKSSSGTSRRRWNCSVDTREFSGRISRATRRTSRLSRYLLTHQASAFIKEVRVKGAICAELIAASTPINFRFNHSGNLGSKLGDIGPTRDLPNSGSRAEGELVLLR